MKIRIFLYFFLLVSLPAFGQKINTWEGTYALKAFDENKKLQTMDTLVIRYRTDSGFEAVSVSDPDEEPVSLQPFKYEPDEGADEYEEFGWTQRFLQHEIKCLSAGHFLICKTIRHTTVDFGNGEKINSRKGIFGIRLHFGLFYLDVLE